MSKSEESGANFLPGDRVRRLSSGQTGLVASDMLAEKIMVRLRDGRTELWHVEETELIA